MLISEGAQRADAVDAVAFFSVCLQYPEAVDRAGWDAEVCLGPEGEVALDLGGIVGGTPLAAVAVLGALVGFLLAPGRGEHPPPSRGISERRRKAPRLAFPLVGVDLGKDIIVVDLDEVAEGNHSLTHTSIRVTGMRLRPRFGTEVSTPHAIGGLAIVSKPNHEC